MGLKADKIRIVDDLKDRLIEESLNEIYVFSAEDLKFLFANKGALKNLGYTLEELQKLTPIDIKPDFEEQTFRHHIKALLLGEEKKLSFKTRHRRKNGSVYSVYVDLQLMEVQGTPSYVAIILDITEQEKISNSLEEKRRLKSLQMRALNNLLKLTSQIDLSRDQKFQKAFEQLFKVPWLKILEKGGVFIERDGVLNLEYSWKLGEKIETLCKKVEKGHCLCGRAFESGKLVHASHVDHNHEVTFPEMTPHGHYNIPLMGMGRVVGVVVLYLKDGHERVDDEVRFLEACADVFAQIIVNQEYEDSLIKAKALAEKGEESKAAFLANMSHEIRTPLNGVIGMAELIKEETSEPETKNKAEIIISSSHSLLTIINDVLDFSKIEAGKIEVYKEPVSLSSFFNEVINLYKVLADKKNLPLELWVNQDVPNRVVIDVAKTKQILSNIISNAIKFTEEGNISVEVSLETTEKTRWLKIDIQDTGIGMSPDQLSKLFQKFSQADESTSRRFGGTGLGMAISKNLAEILGGELTVKSILHHGSIFTLTIPFIPAVTESETMRSEEILEIALPHDLKILFVDDNEINLKVGHRWLNKLGYAPDFASNGEEAIFMISQKDYDIVFMDCHMPILDGYQATKAIKDTLKEKSPYIVATTASVMEEDIKRCQVSGMDDFLPKPISKKTIMEVIGRFVNKP